MVDRHPGNDEAAVEEPAAQETRAPTPFDTGEASLFRRLSAEFVGTLVFVGIGTGTATVLAVGPLTRLGDLSQFLGGAPGEEAVFGNLLGNSLADLMPVAFAFATALAVLVYAFGGVSGAHFNPAVTFALAVARRFKWVEVVPYWVAQVLGGIAGAFVVAGIYQETGAFIGETDILFGATVVQENIDTYNAILAEAFIGFILMTAIMAVAIDPRAPKGWSGLIIGLGLGAGILVTGFATGGSANFARSLGPLVASLPYDVGNIPWGDLVVYAAGPLLGATAAALIYETVTGLEGVAPAPQPGAATPPPGAMGP
ncbi:MAG: MIP/aquaporin family protein [Actinomycetota bacterium]